MMLLYAVKVNDQLKYSLFVISTGIKYGVLMQTSGNNILPLQMNKISYQGTSLADVIEMRVME